MRSSILGSALLLGVAIAAVPGAAAREDAPDARMVELEKAFEADAAAIGIVPAFLRHISDDGIMFVPGPILGRPSIEGQSWPGQLRWRPALVGISAAGDLGFSTGPSRWAVGDRIRGGWYLTLWRREAGGWKFVLDCGTDADPGIWEATPQQAEFASSSVGAGEHPGAADRGASARREVQALELALARDAGPLAGLLAPDARIIRPGGAPRGAEGAAASFPRGANDAEIEIMGSGAATSGDLAYTYGRIGWKDASGRREGYWVRIWQRRGSGWKIVVDRFAPVPAQTR